MFEHAGMAKEVPAFLRAEIANNATDPTQEPQNRMLGRLAQMRLAALEGRDKALLHIGEKHRPVDSSFEHKRCGHAALPQASHEGDCFPMAMRRVADEPLATRSTAA